MKKKKLQKLRQRMFLSLEKLCQDFSLASHSTKNIWWPLLRWAKTTTVCSTETIASICESHLLKMLFVLSARSVYFCSCHNKKNHLYRKLLKIFCKMVRARIQCTAWCSRRSKGDARNGSKTSKWNFQDCRVSDSKCFKAWGFRV